MTALHDLDPVGRFSDRAADYVRYRPTYPGPAVDAILHGLGPPDRLVAADIGAGTGISSRLVAARGVRVLAVEPGESMRSAAAPHERVTWIDGTAEATTLADESVALVLAAQSFHWFRQPEALREFARILQPGGRLAIMWNRRSRTDAFTAAYRDAILEVAGETPDETTAFSPDVIVHSGVFAPPVRVTWPHAQTLDFAGLVGRCHSASYVPKSGSNAERLIALLQALHERFRDAAGLVRLVYETEVYLSHRTDATGRA